MSDKSTENYLDNLLDSMNKLQDTDTKMSGADQDEFLKKFEDELENETYDEYLSNFEKELERENEQAKGQALNVQTPAPDDKDASLDDMLTEFDRRMKEQETQGDKQENKADNNLSDAVFNFTPADSGIEMMDANMPEMAENPKQEETPETISSEKAKCYEGKVVPVLAEEMDDQKDGYVTGRMDNNSIVHFPGTEDMIGNIYNVKLNECRGFYYMGEIKEDA